MQIPFNDIINCTKIVFENTIFTFESNIYKQIYGTPMDSQISTLFADIVMDDLEDTCLRKLTNIYGCVPLLYDRYVDDTILWVKKTC